MQALFLQVKRVEQQFLLHRDKRWSGKDDDFTSERDSEDVSLESEEEKDAIYRKNVLERHDRLGFDFNDPLFKKQWHLVSGCIL